MLLIAGGAYAGKRQYLRKRESRIILHSAYEGKHLADWHQAWRHAGETSAMLVLEGWELWIAAELQEGKSSAQIRKDYALVLDQLKQLEGKARNGAREDVVVSHRLAVIMLEIGRGVVPLPPAERALRDTAGWLQQDAAALCEEAVYVWHGLAQAMKQPLVKPELD